MEKNAVITVEKQANKAMLRPHPLLTPIFSPPFSLWIYHSTPVLHTTATHLPTQSPYRDDRND
jgi:hypothetical protein